ncbi:MAG: hypothetical protein JSS09_03990 [Verrucomicrobia bacterium]|nr:hypothetical protein [Verrucomicrobiota bacterium]
MHPITRTQNSNRIQSNIPIEVSPEIKELILLAEKEINESQILREKIKSNWEKTLMLIEEIHNLKKI